MSSGPGPDLDAAPAFNPAAGIAEDVADKIATELAEHNLANEPIGVDIVEMPVLAAMRDRGLDVVDGQQVFLAARRIKTQDEIALLTQACSMVDAAYEDLYASSVQGCGRTSASASSPRRLRPRKRVRRRGQRDLRERRAPHPHVFSDRILRPGDPAFFDILHSHLGYRTCYYRCFAVGSAPPAMRDVHVRCREYMDEAISPVKPGATTGDIVDLATRRGVRLRQRGGCVALQYGHGVGLAIWEKPIFSRLVSLDHPEPLEEGMVFALETYWPARDGWSAARIEEELVVTADGCEVITKFPAEELLVAGKRYWTVSGHLDTVRESQSHLNTSAGQGNQGRDGRHGPSERAARPVRADGGDPAHGAGHDPVRPGEGHDPPRRRSRGGRRGGQRGAPPTTTCSRIAATTTRWRGATAEECLAELMSKATGCARPRAGPCT